LAAADHQAGLGAACRRARPGPAAIEFGELAVHELDGRSVSWTVTTLAVRGLVLIDPTCPGPPQLSRRGQLILHNAGLISAGPNIT
jgi:hypothetical protein